MLKRWLMDLPEPLLSMDIQEEFGALFMAPLSPQSTDVQAAVQALFQQVRGEGREGSCTGITIAPSRVRWKSLLLHSCLRAGAGGAETFFALHLSFCRCTAHRLLLAVSSLLCLPACLAMQVDVVSLGTLRPLLLFLQQYLFRQPDFELQLREVADIFSPILLPDVAYQGRPACHLLHYIDASGGALLLCCLSPAPSGPLAGII